MLSIFKKKSFDLSKFHFSKREWDVLACIANGYSTTKKISAILCIASKTVDLYINNIFNKTKRG